MMVLRQVYVESTGWFIHAEGKLVDNTLVLVGENGTGRFGGDSRSTGVSRCWNAFSAIVAATSAPMPT